MQAVDSLGDGATGVFGVELFLVNTPGGGVDVLLNEVAPRPHNTGHYTQDACAVSQFENHLRAVCGLPLGDTNLIVGAAASEYPNWLILHIYIYIYMSLAVFLFSRLSSNLLVYLLKFKW